jgi:ABC-type glycerol-3-phosphate transport system substrate-binding protein
MYYNRDLLQGAGIVKAPATWTAFAETVPKLAKKLPDLTLTQNAVALGTFKNIGHAKDIIALLFIQNGNPFVTNTLGAVSTHFGSANRGDEFSSAVEAMSFYMAFSDPNKNVYTWNSGESLDLQAFIESKLVYYFGSASELPGIRSQNPNLNFDVALPPQGSETNAMTSGRFYGLAIPKIAPNQLLSFTAAQLLASTDSSRALTEQAGTTLALMPVRRDVLAQAPVSDKYLSLLYTAALVNRSWFDPNPVASTAIFSTLVSDISSGLLTVEQSLDKAATRIEALGIRGL